MKRLVLFFLIASYSKGVVAQWQGTSSVQYFTGGNVGIGTSSPGNKLELYTTTALDGIKIGWSGTGFVRLLPNSLYGGAYNNITAQGDAGIIYGGTAPDAGSIGFVIAPWSSAMHGVRIDQSGNVGINTNNTKGYQLAVNGSAVFTSATVKLYANWPDYVFEPEYRLPSLDSISAFIQVHHHLPDMPSADSIKAMGVDLGNTDIILLRKIEELTLYQISQKKDIDDLKDQGRQLGEENERLKKECAQLRESAELSKDLLDKVQKLEALVKSQLAQDNSSGKR